jgi:uncharacterized protein (DUF1697 family)
MPRYAAFLRGINVANRRVGKAALCAPFDDLGLEEVTTFRASGNVIFEAPRQSAPKLGARIEAALEKSLGYDVAVFLRTRAELLAIAGHAPFPARTVNASDGKLQVFLLTKKPAAAAQRDVLEHGTDEDRLSFGEKELYWLPSGGMADSALDLKAIFKLIGQNTQRTKGTMEQVAAKYFA